MRWVLRTALIWGVASSSFAIGTPGIRTPHNNWQLVWLDEFNQDGPPDPAKWDFEIGGDGWGNDELEYYTDRIENARVESGHLVIEARKEEWGGNHYTSARIHTHAVSWTYGRFEIRAKLPHGAGIWPAIWMLPVRQSYGDQYWPDNGEIDIMEYFGPKPDLIAGTLHMKNHSSMTGNPIEQDIAIPNVEEDYHVFALEWSPDTARISIDGFVYNTYFNPHTDWGDWPFDKPFYLILNFAIGGEAGGPVDDSIFPQRFLVDYVRVYKSDTISVPLALRR